MSHSKTEEVLDDEVSKRYSEGSHHSEFTVKRFHVTTYDESEEGDNARQDGPHVTELAQEHGDLDEHYHSSSRGSSLSTRSRSRRDSVYPISALDENANPGVLERLRQRMKRIAENPLCPNTSWMLRMLAMIIIGILSYYAAVLLIGGKGWPNIAAAIVIAQVVGHVVHKATSLPPLLGMLIVGACIRHMGLLTEFNNGHDLTVYVVRSFALVTLLVRTSFRLDPARVRRVPAMMLALAILPGLSEGIIVTILAHFLVGIPWQYSSLLGIILAGVCPSVLLPCFQNMGAGRSVNAVLVAAAGITNIIVIFAFGINTAVIFSQESSLTDNVIHRFMGIACGLFLGITFGFIIKYIPDQNDPQVAAMRSILLGSLGLFAIIGFGKIGFFGVGPFLIVAATSMSSLGWRTQGWGPHFNPVATVYDVLWRIMEPFMFCLIGTDVTFPLQMDVVMGIVVLLVAWVIRVILSLAVTAAGDLTVRERFFVTLSWMPKAGVQAALCPFALELADRLPNLKLHNETHKYSKTVMLMVLLAVVLTAPLSAALTKRRGLASVLIKTDDSRRSSAAA